MNGPATWRTKAVVGHDEVIRQMHAAGALDREIAQRLGLPHKAAVSKRRKQLGLRNNKTTPMRQLAPFDDVIREKLQLGWSDSEIAAALPGVDRRQVGFRRAFLGLAASGNNERRRAKVSEKTRAQCKAAGVKSLAELRRVAFEKFASDNGWPAELSPRCVQVLELLLQRGLMTRLAIVKAVYGRVHPNQKKWLFDNGKGSPNGKPTTVLSILMSHGFVVRSPRAVTQGTKRGNHRSGGRLIPNFVRAYGPSPLAIQRKQEFLRTQEKDHGTRDVAGAVGVAGSESKRTGEAGPDRRAENRRRGPRSDRDDVRRESQSGTRNQAPAL